MPLLIKQREVKVVTKDGEVAVTISLDLNINLSNDGSMQVLTQEKKPKEKEAEYLIPEFEASPNLVFGKNV